MTLGDSIIIAMIWLVIWHQEKNHDKGHPTVPLVLTILWMIIAIMKSYGGPL